MAEGPHRAARQEEAIMKGSNYLEWFRRLLVLGAVVAAGAMAATAGAVGRPPDVQDAATVGSTDVGTPPDVRDAATALYTTSAGIMADGLRWQGISRTYQQLQPESNFPTTLGMRADGLRLQGMVQVYQDLQATPDAFERYATAHPYGNGLSVVAASVSRPPDVADAATASTATPDVFERRAANYPYGSGLSVSEALVSRPPDVTDAALSVETQVSSSSVGFDWNDWGIGIGTGMGLALILGGGLLVGRQFRHRDVQPA
jgi:hypothetical protein